ncbi:hypothetical protein J7K24_03175 [bacterium]|nr:hypothetical protein [bacterium]
MEINEENLKEILERQRKEYQDYLGVIFEDFKSKTGLLAESTEGIQRQLISIRDMVAKNTEDIEIIKADIQFIKQELKRTVDQDEFNALEKRVMLLEKKFSDFK